MKSKELIKILKEHLDFDVKVSINLNCNKSPIERPKWQTVNIEELSDIGYSSKQIIFSIEKG